MPRLYLFAEGQTEQTFAYTVLVPHLAPRGVGVNVILVAHARKRGVVHRGGILAYEPVKQDIQRLLKQEKGADVFFTTMIDFYALPRDFPGMTEASKLIHKPYERVEALERACTQDIGDDRFKPYFQLHEYEAYLFSDPTKFSHFYPNHEKQITALQDIAAQYPNPELIDDGRETAPSKRIIAEMPDYKGAKDTIGPQVAAQIGLTTIRDTCPHFAKWLSWLETLGQ